MWIWSVVVDGALYVRACNGVGSSWYQAALKQKAGRVTAAGRRRREFRARFGRGQPRIDKA